MKPSAVTFGVLVFCLLLSIAFGERAAQELSVLMGNDRLTLENGALVRQDEVKWRDMHVMIEQEEVGRMHELASARFLDSSKLAPIQDRVRQKGKLHEELALSEELTSKTYQVIVFTQLTDGLEDQNSGTISELHFDR
jgi:hypothetical protein